MLSNSHPHIHSKLNVLVFSIGPAYKLQPFTNLLCYSIWHKTKTKEKYQNQKTKVMIHKYILKLYTPTLANTLNNQQTYLTFWM